MLAPERQRAVLLMERTVADQHAHGNWRYAAIRPQVVPESYGGAGVTTYADCSTGCRMIARWAGVHDDPAGTGYAPYGNSSSIWAHLPHISPGDLQPGDIITFGYSSGEHHACMAYKHDPKQGWLVWNHGASGQPHFATLGAEQAGHAGMTAVYCRLGVTDPPPTPQDKLRAHTGFYAWVAWRLSEGPWQGYKKADPRVRPNVPKVIWPGWWKRYAAFLLARKKGNAEA